MLKRGDGGGGRRDPMELIVVSALCFVGRSDITSHFALLKYTVKKVNGCRRQGVDGSSGQSEALGPRGKWAALRCAQALWEGQLCSQGTSSRSVFPNF